MEIKNKELSCLSLKRSFAILGIFHLMLVDFSAAQSSRNFDLNLLSPTYQEAIASTYAPPSEAVEALRAWQGHHSLQIKLCRATIVLHKNPHSNILVINKWKKQL